MYNSYILQNKVFNNMKLDNIISADHQPDIKLQNMWVNKFSAKIN